MVGSIYTPLSKRNLFKLSKRIKSYIMDIPTSATLLQRIHRLDDKASWDRFYSLYAPLIRNYARRKGCTKVMADDVIQLTFSSLLKNLPRFQYDPKRGRFRGFLYTIVERRIADAFQDYKNLRFPKSDTENERYFDGYEDPNPVCPCENWDEHCDRNWMRQAYEQVKQIIRKKGDPMTIDIFELFVFQKLSAHKVLKLIFDKYSVEVSENKIFQDKNRVVKIWKSEVKKLREEAGDL